MKLDWYKGIWILGMLLAGVFVTLATFSVLQLRQISLPAALSPEPVSLPLDLASDTTVSRPQINLLERPIFWQERRPLALEASDVASTPELEPETAESFNAQPESLTDFRLRGVFFGDEFKGILYDLAGQRHRAMLGDEIAGWLLTEVEASGITLYWHDGRDMQETRYLELDYSLPAGASASPGFRPGPVEKPVELMPNVQDNEAQQAQDGVNESDAG